MRTRKYAILAVGELLVDFISTDFAETMNDVEHFKRIQGGSPANMCMNMARLGNQTQLVATVGLDDMGTFLYESVQNLGVDCQYLQRIATPSTLILVTRTKSVANFEAYRGADCQITMEQFSISQLKDTAIYHTTCFAMSQSPAQETIMQAAQLAAQQGCQLSIDANYAQKIWQDRAQAQQLVAEYCRLNAIVKVSEVDWERLYETPLTDANTALDHFLNLGAKVVCVTLGGDGCWVASKKERHFLPARPVEVKDTTGAGDAFWSGFLTAFLDQKSLLNCAKAGRNMAEMKLKHFGSLPNKVARELIYEF